MQFIVFILVYPLIWFLSILPLRVLYLLSDFLYLFIYYVFRYRRKVVFSNLKLSFPNKFEKELKQIEKNFYHHFVDIFIEMIKSFSISEKELIKRYKFVNSELINELEKKDKSIIIIGAHYANWEWIIALNNYVSFDSFAAYTKIGNVYFEKQMLKTRERLGTHFIKTGNFVSLMEKNNLKNVKSIYGLLSDQSPQLHKARYFKDFMGVKVPIHTGAEYLGKKFNHVIVLMKTQKIKRGYYMTAFETITESPRDFKDYEITDIFLNKVEQQIKEKPDYYFWSHKRWKHAFKTENNYSEKLYSDKKNN